MSPERRSTLDSLECALCHAVAVPAALHATCGCGGVLLARYRLEEAARTLTRERLRDREPSQWRYAEVLPGSEDPVTLGEGMSPLRPARSLARSLGLERLYLKDESVQPTGSFKARGMATAVTMARKLGAKRLALPSAGNAGGAAAAYGALAGLAVDLFLPDDTPAPFRLEALAFGAEVHLVAGDISHCGARVREGVAREGWLDLSTFREPYRLEGKKTLGYEIAEQLGWELPDVIVYPTGGGTGLVGMWKAFEELERLGLVRGARRPRMIVVQASGCAPLVRAHESGASRAPAWDDPRTYARGLRVPATLGDHLVLRAVRESGGTAVAVSDPEIAEAQLQIARGEGVFACPEGGAALAGLRRVVASRGVDRGERIVLFNTGTGLKYPHVPGLRT